MNNVIDNEYIIQHIKEWLLSETTTKIKMLIFNKKYNDIKNVVILKRR